jgi:hypothetical protein
VREVRGDSRQALARRWLTGGEMSELKPPCDNCERYMRAWLAMEMKPVQELAETGYSRGYDAGLEAAAGIVCERENS